MMVPRPTSIRAQRALCLCIALAGCEQPNLEAADGGVEVEALHQGLYGNEDYLWPGDPPMIPVCWENPSAASAQRRGWVRQTVEQNWARYARVNFTEWDTCSDGDPGVHIRIADDVSSAPGGYLLDGVTDGVTLNLLFDTQGPDGCRTDNAARQHCIRAVALHEFGHVLGFYHEEERDDYTMLPGSTFPSDCQEQDAANSDPQYYGAYDSASVMSYCGQPYEFPSTWKENLSAGDIAAVQRAYGRRIAGSLVSPRGDCVSNHADAPNGEHTFMYDCDEANDDQEWIRDGSHLKLAPNRCLESQWWTNQSGDPTLLWNCGSYPTQDWSFENVEIRGWGGLCLDLHHGNTTPWTNIQMWQCGAAGGNNQKWSITESGQIKFGGLNSNSCVTAYAGMVFIHTCDYPVYQTFDFNSNGEIKLIANEAFCMDVQSLLDSSYLAGSGRPGNGMNVQMYTCLDNQLNQKWNFSGQIHHEQTGLCLDRLWGSANNNTPVQTWTCNSSNAQTWDYYFK